jgi:VanZ family protein
MQREKSQGIIKHFWFLLTLGCVGVVVWAGLWPFDFWADNAVRWDTEAKGLDFYYDYAAPQRYQRPGIVYTPEPIVFHRGIDGPGELTVELTSRTRARGCADFCIMLCLLDESGHASLLIGRWKSAIVVRVRKLRDDGTYGYREIDIADAPRDEPEMVTITSGPKGTRLYLNGVESGYYPEVVLIPPGQDYSHRVVLGAGPDGRTPWSGILYGLSFYRRFLDRATIQRHYQQGSSGAAQTIAPAENLMARYDFLKGSGQTIRTESGEAPGLLIPAHFVILKRIFLQPFWGDSRVKLSDSQDILLNVLGFIPLGFCLAGWLRRGERSWLLITISTAVIGVALSAGIELSQAFTPARDSSALDLLSNTLGSLAGAVAFIFFQRIVSQKVKTRCEKSDYPAK